MRVFAATKASPIVFQVIESEEDEPRNS